MQRAGLPFNVPANGPQKGCLICIAIASLAIVASAAAPYWLKKDTFAYGLWYGCIDGDCEVNKGWEDIKPKESEWFLALRGTAGLSTLFAIIAMIVSLAKLRQGSTNTKNVGLLAIGASVMGIAAVGIFFENQTASILNVDGDDDDNWGNSPVIFAVGSCLIGIFGIFAVTITEGIRGGGVV